MQMPDNIIAYQTADLATGEISPQQVRCTQYDGQVKQIAVKLKENGRDWLPEGYQANVRMKKADGTSVYNPCGVEGSTAYITLSSQMCGVPGQQDYVLELVNGGDVVQTSPARLKVLQNPIDNAAFRSLDEYGTIQEAVQQAQQAQENAAGYYHAILGASVLARSLSAQEYAALDPVSPKTLYVVEGDGPDNYLTAYYPLTQTLQNALNPNQTAVAYGCKGLGNWDGPCFDTSPVSGAVGMHQNYIALPGNLFAGADYTNGITITIDLKPNTTCTAGNGDWTRVFNFYKHANSPTGTLEGELYVTQGLIATAYYSPITNQYLDASVANRVTAGSWHTLAVVLSTSELIVYLDGNRVGATNNTGGLLAQLPYMDTNGIGNSRFADNDFAGLVKNLRIYNRALSQSELSQIGVGGGVKLYWGSTLLAMSLAANAAGVQPNGVQNETQSAVQQMPQNEVQTDLPLSETQQAVSQPAGEMQAETSQAALKEESQ